MLKSRNVVTLAAVALLSLGGAVRLDAQPADRIRIVDFHVNLEEYNRSIGGSVKEGGRYEITIEGRGKYSLTAAVTGAAATQVTFTVHRASGEDAEDLRPIETVRATPGTPVALRSIPLTTVVVERIRTVRTSVAAPSAPAVLVLTSAGSWNAPARPEPVGRTTLRGR